METLFIGKNLIFLPETESTNTYAIELLKNVNLSEGSLVQAASQTNGRGQRGSNWTTEPHENLTFSVVLKPSFLGMKRQFYLYQVTALACHEALKEILGENEAMDIKIKWPNDILVDGKKVAGILIENNVQDSTLNWSVIGIGVNINQARFPGLPNATSLMMLLRRSYPINELLNIICAKLEKYYLALKAEKFDFLSRQYEGQLYGLSAKREFILNENRQTLTVKGVSNKGLLSLEDEEGKEIEADVKELKWVFD